VRAVSALSCRASPCRSIPGRRCAGRRVARCRHRRVRLTPAPWRRNQAWGGEGGPCGCLWPVAARLWFGPRTRSSGVPDTPGIHERREPRFRSRSQGVPDTPGIHERREPRFRSRSEGVPDTPGVHERWSRDSAHEARGCRTHRGFMSAGVAIPLTREMGGRYPRGRESGRTLAGTRARGSMSTQSRCPSCSATPLSWTSSSSVVAESRGSGPGRVSGLGRGADRLRRVQVHDLDHRHQRTQARPGHHGGSPLRSRRGGHRTGSLQPDAVAGRQWLLVLPSCETDEGVGLGSQRGGEAPLVRRPHRGATTRAPRVRPHRRSP
jgi:hypothetical protein